MEFPYCPECKAADKPNCYLAAPRSWYPLEDLPYWHVTFAALMDESKAALREYQISADEGPVA